MKSIKEKAHEIAWQYTKHYDANVCKQEWCEMPGARAIIRKIQEAYNIRGIETMVDQINSFIEELNEK